MEDIKVEDDYCSLQYEFDLFFEAVKSGSKSTLSIGKIKISLHLYVLKISWNEKLNNSCNYI